MAAPMVKTSAPGIYKRGSRYVVSYRVDGSQKWETAGSLAEARRLKAARVAAIDAGEFAVDSRVKFKDYASEWVSRYHGRGKSVKAKTRDGYRRSLERHVYPRIGHIPLAKITTRTLNQFVADMATVEPALSDNTIRNALNPVRSCLATAVDEGLLRYNPARGVYLPHRETATDSEERKVRPFTLAQLDAVMSMVNPKYRDLCELLAGTGLRISEACGLQWQHVHLDGSRPHVAVRRAINAEGKEETLKSRHARRDVPLSPSLVDRLRARRSTTPFAGDADPVFANRNGDPINRDNVRRRFLKPVLGEAGADWKGAGWHTFRHTFASMLFQRGRNIKQVQHLMGHHAASFTLDTYTHLIDGDEIQAFDWRESVNTPQTHQQVTAGNALALEDTDPAYTSEHAVGAVTNW